MIVSINEYIISIYYYLFHVFLFSIVAVVLVNLDPNNYTVTEGEQVTITAVLSREADRPLSVGFFTDDETATGIIEQRM